MKNWRPLAFRNCELAGKKKAFILETAREQVDSGLSGNPGAGRKQHERRNMKMRTGCWITLVVAAGMFAGVAMGQQKSVASVNRGLAVYDVSRETTLLGTVQSYTAEAPSAPFGTHVALQTSGGVVDIHLGDARLLAASHFTIRSGDTLRIIGENVSHGKEIQFVARLVQKGTQVLAVRSVRGIPLSYMAPRTGAQLKAQGGVL